ncbi:hypothetical protein C8A00DRAFT_18026 [Chaetomidium leptoderma]|uniref:DUF1857-domain-containing protein n=1 Tax=Chaetomidium leptoderma TaxID=669021 RepID=A0AAN6ZUE1_9PEZI|nr:hypothetical protein C8A00DRAFT_18026 [Chaetomidium leptoderma]
MVVLNLGYTAPINRPGDEPVLTRAQVWAGLEHKVRRAEKFVSAITACEVLSEDKSGGEEHVITRRATFKPGVNPAGRDVVTEVCHLHAPCRVDFVQEDGTTIGNYVTQGPTGQPEDLHMTYVFQWKVPQVEAGSEQAKEIEAKFQKMAKLAVESSIETIRGIATGKVIID